MMLYYISALAPKRWLLAICGGSGQGRHPALLCCWANLDHSDGCLPPSASHVVVRWTFLCVGGAFNIRNSHKKTWPLPLNPAHFPSSLFQCVHIPTSAHKNSPIFFVYCVPPPAELHSIWPAAAARRAHIPVWGGTCWPVVKQIEVQTVKEG